MTAENLLKKFLDNSKNQLLCKRLPEICWKILVNSKKKLLKNCTGFWKLLFITLKSLPLRLMTQNSEVRAAHWQHLREQSGSPDFRNSQMDFLLSFSMWPWPHSTVSFLLVSSLMIGASSASCVWVLQSGKFEQVWSSGCTYLTRRWKKFSCESSIFPIAALEVDSLGNFWQSTE